MFGRGGGAQGSWGPGAGEEEEVVSRSALAKGISRLADISGPAAQEEARVHALRRAQLLAALREKIAEIPGAPTLWSELEAIEQVSATAPDRKSVV